jgi:cation diffusion facilitator CzcD-associated flavoprotein CzcO
MSLKFPFTDAAETPDFMNYLIDDGRPLKVINIGAGYTGLICCIRIPRKFKNIDFVCYEKNPVAGGTWYQNTYPGVACDM